MKKNFSISLYWKCQLIGWSIASLYWGYLGFNIQNYNYLIGVLQFFSDVALYVLITHCYRSFALRYNWQLLNVSQLLRRIIPAIVVMGMAYLLGTAVKVYLFNWWIAPDQVQPFSVFFSFNGLIMFIAGIRLMSIWLLAYHLYHYAQREINIAKENARLEVITRDAQLNNLSAQLNPHFLFNSLNNIKALVIENPKSARRAIDLLSDLLRTGLYGKDVQLITIDEELGLVKDYLELEKLRFEEQLQSCVGTADGLGKLLIPRFCIQTLVENAIKHGIAKRKDGGLISIKINQDDGQLSIAVQSPGILDINREQPGLGIKNLAERLQLHYKGAAKFAISDENDGHVLATITIPLV